MKKEERNTWEKIIQMHQLKMRVLVGLFFQFYSDCFIGKEHKDKLPTVPGL